MIKSDIKTNTEQIAKYTGKKIDNRGWSWSTHMSHLISYSQGKCHQICGYSMFYYSWNLDFNYALCINSRKIVTLAFLTN